MTSIYKVWSHSGANQFTRFMSAKSSDEVKAIIEHDGETVDRIDWLRYAMVQ